MPTNAPVRTVGSLWWLLTGLVAVLCVASPSLAQSDERFDLAGSIELPRLVDLAAAVAGVPIVYDAGELRGAAVVRSSGNLTPDEVWRLAHQILAGRGFALVRKDANDPALSVVRLNDAATATATLRAGIEDFTSIGSPSFARIRIQVRHADATQTAAAISTVVGDRGVSPVEQTNEIMVTGQAGELVDALELVAQIDQPSASAEIRVYRLSTLTPETAATLARQVFDLSDGRPTSTSPARLFPGPDGVSLVGVGPATLLDDVGAFITDLDERSASETRVYQPGAFGAQRVAETIGTLLQDGDASVGQAPRVLVNELTGTLHVTASPQAHAAIVRILEELERIPPEAVRSTRSIIVSNRPVEQVADIIERLLTRGFVDASTQGGADSAVRPGDREEAGTAQPEVEITVDAEANRILAIGEPRQLDRVEALIDEIDQRQPQVMLEVFLVSLNEGESQDLGVELQYLVSDAGTLVGLTSLFGLSPVTPLDGGPALGGGAGGTAVVLDPGDFSAVITAIEQVSRGRSLSRPRVLVNNNEQATLDSVVEEPFLSTNASDTVATTSFGGSSQAGTQVTVTPQIAAGDHIILEYSVSLSSFTGDSADPALPPPRQQTGLSSRATIPDGHCIVVGGIEITSDANAESRVPLLGEIPLIGELFKDRSRSASRSRFFALIRAEVLRDTSFRDLKHLSRDALDAAEVDDGFPKVHPRIIR
ncbi:MAG: hypothetical protein CMJ31_07755 [Phycisphaerae bacterium]|nr:hypothetical protein [Phycisphaerae bacterium]